MKLRVIICILIVLPSAHLLLGENGLDPGPSLAPDYRLGRAIRSLSPTQISLFEAGRGRFVQHFGVTGSHEGNTHPGLGPMFNLDNCVGCHSHPEIGGSSPSQNPQVKVARALGARNTIPQQVRIDGPTVAARSIETGRSVPLFTIQGRIDASPCEVAQHECFTSRHGCASLAWKISIPLFGLGLLEAIPDIALIQNGLKYTARKRRLGIRGTLNRDASGRITRFGWKAHSPTIRKFVAEALSSEIGISNDLFADEPGSSNCYARSSDKSYDLAATDPVDRSAIDEVVGYLRYLAPSPRPSHIESHPGRKVFDRIGCGACHTPHYGRRSTARSPIRDRSAIF